MLEVILLILAVCVDSFAVSVTYGLAKIRISVVANIIIGGIGAGFLGVSFVAAHLFAGIFSDAFCNTASCVMLFVLGGWCVVQTYLPKLVKHHRESKNNKLSVLSVFFDEQLADADNSKDLSAKEAIVLAIALSIDSIASGFSVGIQMSVFYQLMAVAVCFAVGIVAIKFGTRLGRFLSMKIVSRLDLSAVSGMLLILLGVINL